MQNLLLVLNAPQCYILRSLPVLCVTVRGTRRKLVVLWNTVYILVINANALAYCDPLRRWWCYPSCSWAQRYKIGLKYDLIMNKELHATDSEYVLVCIGIPHQRGVK